MVNNFICEDCKHYSVCSIKSNILKFHHDAKNPLPCDITLNKCDYFEFYANENKQ
jgi:hypothetical protein